MKNITYTIKPRTEKVKLPEALGFGIHFTDSMFEVDYNPQAGWHNATIKPVENFSIHPATLFIHYGQALFEGLKAIRQHDDKIVLFRPGKHFERLNNSAKRLCMPQIDVNLAIDYLKELVAIEKDWIPSNKGEALYIRPFMIGTDPVLGVKVAHNYKLVYLLSPVGAYYAEGFKPVKILIQDEYVRAVRKGMGECKTPGNYAASLIGGEMAHDAGYTQVLWLDGVVLKNIEEVGTMNIFMDFKNEIVTPKLTGGILPGVTRLSVIQILRDWGYNVNERVISVDEFMSEYDKGNVTDVFGTGTAAIISPVGELKFRDKIMKINNGETGELSMRLFNALTGIQYGETEDTYHWLTPVPDKSTN
jgi:branched-chain amino acid aminotransferase